MTPSLWARKSGIPVACHYHQEVNHFYTKAAKISTNLRHYQTAGEWGETGRESEEKAVGTSAGRNADTLLPVSLSASANENKEVNRRDLAGGRRSHARVPVLRRCGGAPHPGAEPPGRGVFLPDPWTPALDPSLSGPEEVGGPSPGGGQPLDDCYEEPAKVESSQFRNSFVPFRTTLGRQLLKDCEIMSLLALRKIVATASGRHKVLLENYGKLLAPKEVGPILSREMTSFQQKLKISPENSDLSAEEFDHFLCFLSALDNGETAGARRLLEQDLGGFMSETAQKVAEAVVEEPFPDEDTF